jgi:hypothetical protein
MAVWANMDADTSSKWKAVWTGIGVLAVYLFLFVAIPLVQAFLIAQPWVDAFNREAEGCGYFYYLSHIESTVGFAAVLQQLLSAWPGLLLAIAAGFLVR